MFVPSANVFLFLIPSNPSNYHLILCSGELDYLDLTRK